MKRYDLKEEKGSFVLLELRPVPVATFAERALAELVLDLLEEAVEEPPPGEAMDYFNRAKGPVVPPTVFARVGAAARAMTPEQFEKWDNALSGRGQELTLKPNGHAAFEPVETAEELTPPPPMAEAVVIVPAEQETETGAAPEGEAPCGGEEAPRLSAAPAEAEAAEAGPSAPPADEPPSWETLHARGLTAKQAAEARGAAASSAYRWAQKAGVEWVSLPQEAPAELAPRPAADLKGWTQEDLDAALLEVEQGGKVEAVADTFGKPAHVLRSQWIKRLAAKREAAGLPLRTNGATQREDAEAGR